MGTKSSWQELLVAQSLANCLLGDQSEARNQSQAQIKNSTVSAGHDCLRSGGHRLSEAEGAWCPAQGLEASLDVLRAAFMFESRLPIVLGSGSPRRKQMLEEAGLNLLVVVPDVDESDQGQTPSDYLDQVVLKKLRRAQELLGGRQDSYSALICADTIVCCDGAILQKPKDEDECSEMLVALSGRQHFVMSSYVVLDLATGQERSRRVTTEVRFRAMSPGEIHAYVRTGEGLDKAGGYAVQGRGAVFLERISGSYSNVVGLPLCELFADLCEMQLIIPAGVDAHRGA